MFMRMRRGHVRRVRLERVGRSVRVRMTVSVGVVKM